MLNPILDSLEKDPKKRTILLYLAAVGSIISYALVYPYPGRHSPFRCILGRDEPAFLQRHIHSDFPGGAGGDLTFLPVVESAKQLQAAFRYPQEQAGNRQVYLWKVRVVRYTGGHGPRSSQSWYPFQLPSSSSGFRT